MPNSLSVKCHTCEVGVLQRMRKYRKGRTLVVIGYMLLLLSVLGMFLSALEFFSTMSAVSATKSTGTAGVIGSGLFILIGIASPIGCLLGWLLVLKIDVFQCAHCGAVMKVPPDVISV
jgi:hypothetical protein